MIRKVLIKNFQRQTKGLLKFKKGLNTIVGESDIGKSSVLRAIKWTLRNTPQGNDFITRGEEVCEVKLKFGNHTISRRKSTKKLNEYQIDDQEPFVSFGRSGVPEEIEALTQVNDLNFQDQHNALFWFDLSASDVSKEINKLVDLEQADSVISDSRKKIRENTAVIKADKASIAEAEEELKESEGIEELFTHVSKTRSLIDKLEDLYLDIEDLDELIEETLECEKTIEGLGDVIESVEVPDISSYSSARKKHLEILTIIEQIDRIVIPEDPSSVQLPHGEFTDLQKHQGSIEALYRTIQAVVDCEFMIRTHNDELDDLSSELKELQEKRKVCPTCQRPL